ncbi:uroporphyrinogen-III C-methyltransferase [Salinithrix halophila]|uniref:uroporphyrinogen-III C-methyltransferase n=1 Tax=Salinithrix halophila TaxID=1485204 RepID=A0ABV8JFR5_9BACL
MEKGFVFIVGAGPGAPGLITVKGKEALEMADVVLYDRLVSPRLLESVPDHCEKIDVGKRPSSNRWTQQEINRTLVQKAGEGKTVVRLKGGDPFVFGRGGEEAATLVQAGVPFDVIPGISSVTAVPAYAGIPVTHRDYNSSFAVVTGHERPDKKEPSVKWKHLAKGPETLVILMGVSNLDYICEQLIQYGRSPETPVALVRWGSRIDQETLTGTLSDIAERVIIHSFKSPAVIIVGEVVRERERLSWYEPKPLFGTRILVPRTRQGPSVLSKTIEFLGGEAVEFPVACIRPTEGFLQEMSREHSWDWLLFSHVSAVDAFFRALGELEKDIRAWAGVKVAAIGDKTAKALQEKGVCVESFAADDRVETLLEAMEERIAPGEEVLLLRGRSRRDELAESLRQVGCRVTETKAFGAQTVFGQSKEAIRLLLDRKADWIAFASSSTVRHFSEVLRLERPDGEELLHSIQIACIGPETAQAAGESGMRVDVEANPHTVEGLVEGISRWLPEPKEALAGLAD